MGRALHSSSGSPALKDQQLGFIPVAGQSGSVFFSYPLLTLRFPQGDRQLGCASRIWHRLARNKRAKKCETSRSVPVQRPISPRSRERFRANVILQLASRGSSHCRGLSKTGHDRNHRMHDCGIYIQAVQSARPVLSTDVHGNWRYR